MPLPVSYLAFFGSLSGPDACRTGAGTCQFNAAVVDISVPLPISSLVPSGKFFPSPNSYLGLDDSFFVSSGSISLGCFSLICDSSSLRSELRGGGMADSSSSWSSSSGDDRSSIFFTRTFLPDGARVVGSKLLNKTFRSIDNGVLEDDVLARGDDGLDEKARRANERVWGETNADAVKTCSSSSTVATKCNRGIMVLCRVSLMICNQ